MTVMHLDRELSAYYPAPRRALHRRGELGAKIAATMAMPVAAREERVSQMVVMRAAGVTLEKIGEAFGLTRERVRQLLKGTGSTIGYRNPDVDPIAIVRAIRQPHVVTLADVASTLGIEAHLVHVAVRHLGLTKATQRLFHWRRDRRLVDAFLVIAATIGRTPTVRDIQAHGLYQADVQKRFGGMQKLAQRAGLVPNKTGRAVTTYTRKGGRMKRADGAA